MRRNLFFNFVFVLSICGIVTMTACSRSAQTAAPTDIIPTSSGTGTLGSTSTGTGSGLPANIFDTSTSQDPFPTSSTSQFAQPNTQYACAQTNSGLLGNMGTLTSLTQPTTNTSSAIAPYCYSGNALTLDSIWNSGLFGAQSMNDIAQRVAAFDPGPTASQDAQNARALIAKMAILRTARMILRSRQAMIQWQPYQAQQYSTMDGAMYIWLQNMSQGQPFSYNGYTR